MSFFGTQPLCKHAVITTSKRTSRPDQDCKRSPTESQGQHQCQQSSLRALCAEVALSLSCRVETNLLARSATLPLSTWPMCWKCFQNLNKLPTWPTTCPTGWWPEERRPPTASWGCCWLCIRRVALLRKFSFTSLASSWMSEFRRWEDMKKEQHHELDEGLVEVETSVGALLKPPESERGGLEPTEPVFKLNRVLLALVLSKMTPTSWRGRDDPPPQGRPPHRPPEPRFEEKTASWTCFFLTCPDVWSSSEWRTAAPPTALIASVVAMWAAMAALMALSSSRRLEPSKALSWLILISYTHLPSSQY